MTVSEKAAYIKGLVAGLGITPESKDGLLWNSMTDLLSDLARKVEDLEKGSEDFAIALDDINEDLSYLEDMVDSCCPQPPFEDDFMCDGDCDGCEYEDECETLDVDDLVPVPEDEGSQSDSEPSEEEDDLNDDDAPEYKVFKNSEPYTEPIYDVVCPVCGEEITIDEDIRKEGSIKCPGCGELLEFEDTEE